jgi:hypothetical protein
VDYDSIDDFMVNSRYVHALCTATLFSAVCCMLSAVCCLPSAVYVLASVLSALCSLPSAFLCLANVCSCNRMCTCLLRTFPGPSVMNSGAMTKISTKSAKRGQKRRKKRCYLFLISVLFCTVPRVFGGNDNFGGLYSYHLACPTLK